MKTLYLDIFSGVTVVNIDNGFGGGYAASQINALATDCNALRKQ